MTVSPEQVAAAKAAYDKRRDRPASRQGHRGQPEGHQRRHRDRLRARQGRLRCAEAEPGARQGQAAARQRRCDDRSRRVAGRWTPRRSRPRRALATRRCWPTSRRTWPTSPMVPAQDIYDGLVAAGVEMAGADPRSNLTSYLSRWGTAGSLVDKGTGKWGVAPADLPPPPRLPRRSLAEAPAS
jgi:hypothetical protein